MTTTTKIRLAVLVALLLQAVAIAITLETLGVK
jgi:hypothetical protein